MARSDAFRRRYWSGLYICKAIEVMHRRILGRPTFGRWEIDSYFDTAARQGFYGVVDAMVNSREYNECFARGHRSLRTLHHSARPQRPQGARPAPALDVAALADLTPVKRPDVAPPQQLRTVGDVVPRNLPDAGR